MKRLDQSAPRGVALLLWWVVVPAMLLLYGAAIWFADLNQDEGWYLYAGAMVARGQLPFVDFASTQGPLMSLVYGAAHGWVARYGLVGGRLFTACLGIGSALLAAGLANRLMVGDGRSRAAGARQAALFALVLCGLSLYQVTFTATVKTYALTSLFLMLGWHALLPMGASRAYPLLRGLCAGLLMAAATATRSSAFAVMPVVGIWLLVGSVRGACRVASRWTLVGFVAGGLAGAMLFFGPYVMHAWPAVEFGLIRYHAARVAGSAGAALAYKAGFLVRLVGYYLPAVVGLIVLGAVLLVRKGQNRAVFAGTGVLWGAVAALTLLHLLAPFPYDDYQVIAYPMLCAALAVAGVRGCGELGLGGQGLCRVGAVLFLVVVCHSVSGPLFQGWFVGPRDRIWWPLKQETQVQRLRRVARELMDEGARPGEELLTQDAYLAVETGMRLPRGLEMGPFAIFPALTDAEAAAMHVVNVSLLQKLISESDACFAAFSGYGLAVACPGVTELSIDEQEQLWEPVRNRYRDYGHVDGFGQAYTTLRLMRKRGCE